MVDRVHTTKDKEPLFERYGVEKEIASTLDRRVDLPSGGYLIFDYAEAFTVIDVNTGRFVGSRSKTLDAAARGHGDEEQPRGGEGGRAPAPAARHRRDHRHRLHRHGEPEEPAGRRGGVPHRARARPDEDVRRRDLAARPRRDDATERDGRPARGDDARAARPAPATESSSRTRRTRSRSSGKLRALAVAGAGSRVQAYSVAVHPRTLALLAGPGGARLAALEDATRRRFYLVPAEGHAHHDHFEVLAEGRRADLAPAAPVEEGAEVELKLVEVDLHDLGAAVGKVDGLDVVVAETAKLVGKKAKVVVGRVLEGQAFATLVDTATMSDADHVRERGREAHTRARPAEDGRGGGGGAGSGAPEAEAETEVEATGDDTRRKPPRTRPRTAPRSRRRRSARGAARAAASVARSPRPPAARRRRRTTTPRSSRSRTRPRRPRRTRPSPRRRPSRREAEDVLASAPHAEDPRARHDGNGAEPPEAVPAEAPPAEAVAAAREEAPIEVAETDGEAPPPKKRTRRGTRGGRNRKRKPAAANGDGGRGVLGGRPVGGGRAVGRRRGRRRGARARPGAPARAAANEAPEGGYVPCPSGSRTSTGGPEPRSPAPDLRYNPAARGRLPAFPRQVTQA